jgi:hypothetical protein
VRTRGIVGGCLAVGLAACGFSAVGGEGGDVTTNGDGGSSSSSGTSGTSGNVSGDGGATSVPFVECDSGLVDPRLVILPADGGACPFGTTEQTLQTAPQANAGACTCGACTPTTEPTCAGPNFTWTWGPSNTCTVGPANYNVTADNACVVIFANMSTTIDVYNRWNRVPQGGSCTAAAVADTTKLTTTAVRQCIPTASGLCAAVSGGQRTCVPGDVDGGACTGMFSVPVVVGDGASLGCEACGCARTATACNVEYHDTLDCSATKKYERLADNQCLPTGTPMIRAIKVYPTPATCVATPGLATAGLTKSRMLCCTP